MAARRACALLAGLLASAEGFAPNPASCATNAATAFNDAVGVVGNIVRAVQNCIPVSSVTNNDVSGMQRDCADQIMGLLTNIGAVGKEVSAATFNCGNVDSGCAQQILAGINDLSEMGQDIISSVSNCPSKIKGAGLFCAADIVAILNKAVNGAKDIDSAVERCMPPEDFIAPPPSVNDTNETDISAPRPNSVDELPTIPAASAPSPTPASVDDLPTAPVGDLPERRRLASSSPEGSRGVAVQDLAEQVPWAQSRPEALLPLDPIVV